MSDKSTATSEMKRKEKASRRDSQCQLLQSSKIKLEKGLLDEMIRPSLVSLDEAFSVKKQERTQISRD